MKLVPSAAVVGEVDFRPVVTMGLEEEVSAAALVIRVDAPVVAPVAVAANVVEPSGECFAGGLMGGIGLFVESAFAVELAEQLVAADVAADVGAGFALVADAAEVYEHLAVVGVQGAEHLLGSAVAAGDVVEQVVGRAAGAIDADQLFVLCWPSFALFVVAAVVVAQIAAGLRTDSMYPEYSKSLPIASLVQHFVGAAERVDMAGIQLVWFGTQEVSRYSQKLALALPYLPHVT